VKGASDRNDGVSGAIRREEEDEEVGHSGSVRKIFTYSLRTVLSLRSSIYEDIV
jgi:hypothetical protein